MMKKLLSIILCTLTALFLSASVFSKAPELRFQNLTIADGLSNNTVRCIMQDSRGFIWFGTPNGLNKYDGYRFTVYSNESSEPNGASCIDILSLFEDRRGDIWIGTKACGIYKYDREKDKLVRLVFNKDPTHNLNSYNVRSIFEDSGGRVWVGTEGGLYSFLKETGEITHYQHLNDDSTSLSHTIIYSILEDRKNRLWIGTDNGLNLLDHKTGRCRRFFYDPDKSDRGVLNIYEDTSGNLWMGIYNGGVIRFNPDDETHKRFVYDKNKKNTISGNNVFSLTGDGQGHLFFGTENGGLNVLDLKTGEFSYYTFKLEDEGGIASNSIYSLYYSSNDILWAGTFNGGVNYASRLNQVVRHYKAAKDGLNNPYILAITENKNGNLWIGTDGGGLNHFDRKTERYTYYVHDENDSRSLAANEVTTVFQDRQANIWVGLHRAGLDLFDPQTGRFTHFSHVPGDNNTIQNNVINAILEDRRGNFYVGTETGLDCNEEGAAIRIKIIPPWWKTSWASLLYILFIGFLFYGVWRFQLNRARMKHELALEHLHAEKLEEVNQMKSRFFTNITHEFRTPLTLIIGQIKELLNNEAHARSQFQMILRNSQKLYQLINQLLDLSKLEAGYMPLRARKLNIVALLRDLLMLFVPLAERKQITLQFSMLGDSNNQTDCLDVYLDHDKLEKIVSNLLSNAIKFTPEGGNVDMHVKRASDGFVEILVKDNGPGIPEEFLDKVFERFYQVDDSNTRSHEGTGIGLALSKELIELHHGTVHVETSGAGTTFTVRLPIDKAHFAENEIIAETSICEKTDSPNISWYDYLDADNGEQTEKPKVSEKSPLILIVEDNTDLRRYLRNNLNHEYNLIEAKDGQEGIDKAIEAIPDLIVSDVMMPLIDGFELCARIKKDERTSHIPVILLTARSTGESKIEGLETGADDYIIKPFEMKELLARMRNLIEQRRQLRMRFNRNSGLKPEEIAVTSLDERLLKKALAIIEENMSDPDFGVAKFASKIAMSRVQLHRKIHSLTGQSTSEFIRVVRLNRAAQLLKQQHDNITQIAFLVGFNSSSYFSRSFYKHFGVSPSEYIENNHS